MSNKVISTAISAVLALGISSNPALAHSPTSEKGKQDNSSTMQMGNLNGTEKCYGIAKANQNDCGNSNHNCAGEAKLNGDKKEWVAVPAGLCNKILGGDLKEPEVS